MKIMLATFLYEPNLGGGAAQVVNHLAKALVAEGHQVVVMTTWSERMVHSEMEEGVKIIRLPASNLYWIAEKDKKPILQKAIWQMIDTWNPWIHRLTQKVIEQEKPDVFHSHKLRGLSPSIWSAAAQAGVKHIIHTCHDFELISPQGLLAGCVGQMALNQNILLRPYQVIRRNATRQISAVSAPSRFALTIHDNLQFFQHSVRRIIPNSNGYTLVQLEQIKRNSSKRPLELQNEPLRVLFLGRLEPEKGIIFLCDVFQDLSRQKINIFLDVAGFGSLESLLREKYQKSDNICFHGPAFGEKKEHLLRNCDLLIVPSLCSEVSPVVIPEAYAYGKPVLVSEKGGMPELVLQGSTGYLFDAGRPDVLRLQLIDLAKKVDEVRGLSENCFLHAKEFSDDVIRNDFSSLYS